MGFVKKRAMGADERGVSIIELLFAITIFAVIAGAVALAMGSTLTLTRNNRNRSIAANLAAREMDKVRAMDFASLPLGLTTSKQIVDDVEYTIDRGAQWLPLDANTGACDSPSGSRLAFLRITVTVTWPNMAGAIAPQSQTVVTPPIASYDAAKGHLAVKVRNRSGALAGGHLVTVTGVTTGLSAPSPQTTVDGCAFFPYLSPGAYNVKVGPHLSGSDRYVDPNGQQIPEGSVSVETGGIASIEFEFDKSATVTLALGQDPLYPVPSGLQISMGNPRLLPAGYKSFVPGSNPRTIPAQPNCGLANVDPCLYPFADGYTVWTGACPDNDPEGEDPNNGRIYPEGVRQSRVSAEPPSAPPPNNSVVVQMERTEVLVTRVGLPEIGASVQATHVGGIDCTPMSFNLGVTDILGRVRASLPYGNWTFTASGKSTTVKLDPSIDDPTTVHLAV